MNILVSVCIVTYNQERFVEQTLQSILNQNTNFQYEVIIGDDCSTDSTRKIIEDFLLKYPDIIVPVFHEKNIGPLENLKAVYRKAKGKYICHLDGDDLALPVKLQRQFDVMESNPDCVICTHDMRYIDAEGNKVREWTHQKGKFDLNYLYLNLPFFAHSSKMFRNDFMFDYFDELHPQALDIEIHIEQAKKGLIYHLDEELGAYRVDVGISTIGKKINPILPKGLIRAYEKAIFEEKNEIRINELKRVYAKTMLQYARQFYLTNSDYKVFCMLVRKSLSIKFYTLRQLNYYLLMLLPKKIIYNRK
ncbi:glycosyltransferase family 2 protein [Acinetobacter towneri]|uniref:glycosyltransferase family 2 protein n=1 Tax=Acinetobacter towneri TaxID=202956 RepID=UPI002096892E|nr:glycosyltransferase [Acinetobacter towneri]MCO8059271.1 glycosyltransferase [Acinetobacter towneri]MCO8064996.1 glycosyltransferase [Acinetobacter towneri]